MWNICIHGNKPTHSTVDPSAHLRRASRLIKNCAVHFECLGIMFLNICANGKRICALKKDRRVITELKNKVRMLWSRHIIIILVDIVLVGDRFSVIC